MNAVRTVTVQERRRNLMHAHHHAGDADGPESVVAALIALHATDPSSVYLSVLARSDGTKLPDVAEAMYGQRRLVRWMAMRRTLFVFAREEIPTIQAAVSSDVAATLRRRLIRQLERNGTEPPIEGNIAGWLADLEAGVENALSARGVSTGAQLAAEQPALQTRILPRTASEQPHNITTPLLTLMAADGRLVRSTPTGAWTSRQHRWEPIARWWPEGLPAVEPDHARRDLARRYLARFGPASIEDLKWWTGWNLTTTRRTLEHLPIEHVDLHGGPGIDLADADRHAAEEPAATLLPALDPTPMGWKRRDWFLGIEAHDIFDRTGNIGPSVWWDGEIIGSWAITLTGELRWKVVADRGAEAREAIEQAASKLHSRLDGTVVTSAIRTPLERHLAGSG
jgi:hypothetical protein